MAQGHTYNKMYNEEDWLAVNEENKQMMDDFLVELKSTKKKPGTIREYHNDLRVILLYVLRQLKNVPITNLTKKDFRKFSLWLSETNKVSNARTNRILSVCRSFLNFLEDDDEYEYDNNAARKVKGLPKETVRDIVFVPDDVVSMLREKLIREERYQEATLLSLMYDSAARRHECYQVEKFSFYDEEANATNKVVGKRGKVFKLIYFSETKRCAKLYLEQRGQDELKSLWCSWIGNVKFNVPDSRLYHETIGWREDLKELTGEDYEINCHSFRHSALENMSNGTHYICRELGIGAIPLEKLKLVANHSDLNTTASYLADRSTQELENLFNIKI